MTKTIAIALIVIIFFSSCNNTNSEASSINIRCECPWQYNTGGDKYDSSRYEKSQESNFAPKADISSSKLFKSFIKAEFGLEYELKNRNVETRRAQFPNIREEHINKEIIYPAPFYKTETIVKYITLKENVNATTLHKINSIGHWMNQNIIIRLYSILEYYKIVGNKGFRKK